MNWTEVLLAFGAKVLSGCLYGYIFLHYYGGDDTWNLHFASLREKEMLLRDPYQFFWEFGPATAIRNGDSILKVFGFYLSDLEYCLQAKTLGIVNIISQGNYYVNVVFWNFIMFWGHYWLFKLLVTEFPSKRKIYFLLVFLFPPAIFWLSGIRADGMLFASFALSLSYFSRWLTMRRRKLFLISLLGFVGVLIFRAPVAALMLPMMLSWWLSTMLRQKQILAFLLVYFLSVIIFFGSSSMTSLDLPKVVVEKQHEFFRLRGTTVELDSLRPTFKSFAVVLPQAAGNTFTRPFPWETNGLLQVMAAVDILFFWAFFAITILYRDPGYRATLSRPLLLSLLFWSVSLYIFIGYTIPFPGAIVRYKIIGELCLLAVIASVLKPLKT